MKRSKESRGMGRKVIGGEVGKARGNEERVNEGR